jgi:hypothetical protein
MRLTNLLASALVWVTSCAIQTPDQFDTGPAPVAVPITSPLVTRIIIEANNDAIATRTYERDLKLANSRITIRSSDEALRRVRVKVESFPARENDPTTTVRVRKGQVGEFAIPGDDMPGRPSKPADSMLWVVEAKTPVWIERRGPTGSEMTITYNGVYYALDPEIGEIIYSQKTFLNW